MADKDYYSILGLSEDDKKLHGKDFDDKLSKAFRKLSLKWHPDRWVNGTEQEKKTAEEHFKEISEAYSVLSDEEQRAKYDNADADFDPFHGFDPFSGFPPGFGHFNFNFNFGGGPQQHGPMPINGSDVLVDVTISIYEAHDGALKQVTYQHEKECEHCHGTGSEDGKTHTCTHCNGTGKYERVLYRDRNQKRSRIEDCPYCFGTGHEPENKCTKCGGIGYTTVTETKEIPIPKGVDNGTTIGYAGLGNPGRNGGATGALEVRFTIREDPYYIRDGADLTHVEEVPFADAMLGCKREVGSINGTKISIDIPELTESGTVFSYAGRGMPTLDRYGRNGPNGSYHVIIKYKMPKKLTKKQKDILKQFQKEDDKSS